MRNSELQDLDDRADAVTKAAGPPVCILLGSAIWAMVGWAIWSLLD